MFKKLLSILCFIFVLNGCSTNSTNTSIITANQIREIAIEENKMIISYCVPKYQSAKSIEDIQKVDKICLPAKVSYHAVRAAWLSLVLSIEKAKNSNEDNAEEIQKNAMELINNLEYLRKTLEMMK